MIRWFLILTLCLAVSGCTALRDTFKDVTSVGQLEILGPTPVPAEPTDADLVALRQKAADLIERALECAAQLPDLTPKLRRFMVLAESAAALLVADVGRPAKELPLPVDEASREEVADLLDDYRKGLGILRVAFQKWRQKLAEIAAKPSRRAIRLTSGLAWHYVAFGVGGLGLLIAGLWRKLKGWSRTAIDIVTGVQAAREVAGKGTAARKLLNAALFANTTERTRDKIQKVKDADNTKARVAETCAVIRTDSEHADG